MKARDYGEAREERELGRGRRKRRKSEEESARKIERRLTQSEGKKGGGVLESREKHTLLPLGTSSPSHSMHPPPLTTHRSLPWTVPVGEGMCCSLSKPLSPFSRHSRVTGDGSVLPRAGGGAGALTPGTTRVGHEPPRAPVQHSSCVKGSVSGERARIRQSQQIICPQVRPHIISQDSDTSPLSV